MTDELYLILHKVRDEPAFDIAIREPKMDCDDQLAWIIPVCDSAAYPLYYWPLQNISGGIITEWLAEYKGEKWDNLPDFAYRPPKGYDSADELISKARAVLLRKGVIKTKPAQPAFRRF